MRTNITLFSFSFATSGQTDLTAMALVRQKKQVISPTQVKSCNQRDEARRLYARASYLLGKEAATLS